MSSTSKDELPSTEGKITFTRGGETYETYYKIVGSITSDGIPLVTLHGGPGSTHQYLLALSDLASPSRAVIFYDQLGGGNSTHLRDKPASFWTPELFVDELANLMRSLGVSERYDLLGHSWGGMLAAQFASTFRGAEIHGLRRLILNSAPASMELFERGVTGLVKQLPEDVQETLKKNEDQGTTDSEEYQEAIAVFYERHLCRLKPIPEDVLKSLASIAEDPTVYNIMNGPSELQINGSLKTWTIIPSIPSISVQTLLLSGAYDEVQKEAVQPFFEKIPNVDWTMFAESSHLAHLEERAQYMRVVGEFLE